MAAKILVVDDEKTIRSFIVRVLERAGYTVESAADGQEALEKLHSGIFDLLLTDVRMDRLDGVDLLRQARSRYPDLAAILFTGHATVPSAVEALRRGAYDYLLKPVRNEDILRVVAEALNDREREQRRDRLENIAGELMQVMGEVPAPSKEEQTKIEIGDLSLNTAAYVAMLRDERLDLTPTEFRLLTELSRSPGAALGYVQLVQSACGYTCTRQEAREIIGTHVLNLRGKLDINADHPYYVESVRGVGYRLVPPDERG
jgi:DNA-binding response OmpR family regulator